MKCNNTPIKAGVWRCERISSVRSPWSVWVGICLPALVLGRWAANTEYHRPHALNNETRFLADACRFGVWWRSVPWLTDTVFPVTSHSGEQRKEQALGSFLIRTLVPLWGSILVNRHLAETPPPDTTALGIGTSRVNFGGMQTFSL